MSARPLVFVIDDLPQNVELVGEYLSDTYEIGCAFSGQEGLALIAESLPDLILLDVMMPGMDGYAVCDALKRDPRTRDVPLIFVTAKNDAESESRALAGGAVDFIHKPVNRDVVRARVSLHLALKARERQLQQLNAELERRVAERTEALRDALVRAQAAHRAKSLFLANINHELRTPMSVIFGFADLLARQVDEPKLRERVEKIKGAGRQLLGIVNDIIDISDLEAGRVQIDSIDFALPALFDTACDVWCPRAAAKSLALVREFDPALPVVLRGDPVRLGQILGNMLDNAVKFSEHGRIILRANLIEAKEDGLVVRFEVEDQGIGIEAERQAAIFNSFEQADNSYTRQYGGIGLGLAICKQLAQLMAGEIGVHSILGQGSLFWVTVRLGLGVSPVATLQPAETAGPAWTEGTAEVDWNQIRQVFIPLIGMLALGDIQAYMIWGRAGHLLEPILGERSDAFNHAMEHLEFAAALAHLQERRAAYPQLATAWSGAD